MARSGHYLQFRIPGLCVGLALLLPLTAGAGSGSEWRFRVYLDESEIGYHRIDLDHDGSTRRVVTEARFDVTFLKLPVFSYRHSSVETWHHGCLTNISSSTEENGRQFRVEGNAGDGGFMLSTRNSERLLPGCVQTFAYWDKAFLEAERLLNAQTGEYLAVEVTDLGNQTITLTDTEQNANRYRLNTGTASIELWYSDQGRWLALQSVTDSGRVLRYVME